MWNLARTSRTLLAAALVGATMASPTVASAQVSTTGNCTVNIVRSAARDITVTGCNQNRARLDSLQESLNRLLANQAIEVERIDEIIVALNSFFRGSEARENEILELSYASNDKITKILDFLESFQEKPEDAAGLIPLLSNGNLSHIQKKKPFGIQIINVVRRSGLAHLRIVLRLVESGPDDYMVGVKTASSGKDAELDFWNIVGSYGTVCKIRMVPVAFEIGRSIYSPHDSISTFRRSANYNDSNTNSFPRTIVVDAICDRYINGDDLTMKMRFYFGKRDLPDTEWQKVEFRFDVSKQTITQ